MNQPVWFGLNKSYGLYPLSLSGGSCTSFAVASRELCQDAYQWYWISDSAWTTAVKYNRRVSMSTVILCQMIWVRFGTVQHGLLSSENKMIWDRFSKWLTMTMMIWDRSSGISFDMYSFDYMIHKMAWNQLCTLEMSVEQRRCHPIDQSNTVALVWGKNLPNE